MASRNPLLDAMNGGGRGNPLLDAIAASEVSPDAVAGMAGGVKRPPLPSLAETITDPNSFSGVMAAREAEKTRLPGERGMGDARPLPADTANILRGLGITTVEAWKQAGLGIKMQAQDLLGPAIDGWIEQNMPGAMTQNERRAAFGGTEAEKDFARSQSRGDAATPAFESDFWEAVYGGVQSTLQTAPGIAAGVIGGPAAGLTVLGGQVGGQAYGKYRARGATPGEASLGAIGEGGVEVATELLPMGFLVNKLGKVGAGQFIAGLLARELPTEQVATFAQDAIDTAIANPEKTWEEFWKERPDAAYKTAIATVVQAGVYGGVGAIASRAAPAEQANPAYTQGVNQSAVEAFEPDGKENIPLSAEDRASPIPDALIQKGKNTLADAMGEPRAPKAATPVEAARKVAPAGDTFSRMVQITLGSESGNRDFDANGNVLTSPVGAKGKMQVMDATNRDPGYGVRPAADNSLEERARVGRDYLAALLREYKGDPAKAWASYNWGAGNLNKAIAEHGGDWLSHAPAETRSYVMKNLSKLGREGFDTATGEVATIPAPEQSAMDTEDPIAFAARILGEDFLNRDVTASAPQETAVSEPLAQPVVTAPTEPVTQFTPQPESNDQTAMSGPVGADQLATPNAPAEIRGEAIDDEWSRFTPESGTLNLRRADMPQIKAENRGAFVNFLKGRGFASREINVPAADLTPTQSEFSEARVQKAKDRTGGNRAILVSSDGYIVDGHHQWLAARDNGEAIRAIEIDAPIAEVLRAGIEFPSSTVDEGAAPERGRATRDRRDDIETDVLTFLAANGGISDDPAAGHNLRAGRNLQRFIPGLGSLVRPGGMSIDYARERLVEAGWLPDGASEADALDLIEQGSFNPVYHPASERGARAAVGADRDEAQQRDALELVRQEAQRLGLETLTDRDMQRAAELTVTEGYSERDALWAALEQAIVEDFNAYPAKAQEEYNVPFDDTGAQGWQAVQDPFAEPADRSAGQESGERPTSVERAAEPSESADGGPSEVEGGKKIATRESVSSEYTDRQLGRVAQDAQIENNGFQTKEDLAVALSYEVMTAIGNENAMIAAARAAVEAGRYDLAEMVSAEAERMANEADRARPSVPQGSPRYEGAVSALEKNAQRERKKANAVSRAAKPHNAGASVEDTPSGKGVIVRGATDAQLAAIKAALPENASGMAGRDGGVTYSKKHEAKIRAALQAGEVNPARPTPTQAEIDAVEDMVIAIPTGRYSDFIEELRPPASRNKNAITSRAAQAGRFISDMGIDRVRDVAAKYQDAPAAPIEEAPPEGRATDIEVANAALSEPAREPKTLDEFIGAVDGGYKAHFDYAGTAGRTVWIEKTAVGWSLKTKNDGSPATSTLGGAGAGGGWSKGEALRRAEEEARYRFTDWKPVVETKSPPEGRTADAAQASPPASAPTVKVYRSGTGGNGGWFTTSRTYAEQLAARDATPLWEGEIPRSDPVFADADVNDPGLQLTYQRDFAPGEIANVKKVADAPGRVTETVTADTPRQFEGNRLFTADRVEAARARLKQKLSGTTLNSGIDPEVLMDGMTVAGAYIESGVRRFADVARALSTDLGQSMPQLRPYLAAWYNGARDLLEGQGEDVSDMDGPGAVRAALTMIENSGGAQAAAEVTSPVEAATEGDATAAPGRLEDAFVDAFMAGRAFASITEARAFAAEIMGERVAPGTAQAKALDEAIESAVVIAARNIAVQNEADPVAAYRRLVQLYGQQPTLGVRTSTSVEQQAYSTPVPLSYLASRLAGINQNTTVYEPSAGNGSLLIDARATYVTANELNPDRAAQLRRFLRGGTVTENDAAETRPTGQFDVVIGNPPFGAVKDDAGNTVRFDVGGGYSTNEIDHAIAMKALEAMKDGGRAVLIVGGINKTITDPRKRADAYNGKAKREFYFKLYSQYNVTDHFTVDGSLYAKQGAGWPVDVIVINGRGKSSLRLPAISAPPQYASWDALQEKVNDRNATSAGAVRGANGSPAAQGARPVATDVGNSGRSGERGDNGRAGRDQAQQPSPVRDGPVDGQPSGVRMDADSAGVGQAAEPNDGGAVAQRNPVTPEVEENARQVAYTPGSRSDGMGTLVPVNMQTAISDALASLEERRGNIDAYVGDRLGYTANELVASFGAEQVDAIGLAIDNIERGAGFVIGDQTGVGKGRVNAAVIRYAIKTGRNAIFVTEKPNLYADMFRDMEDIGLPKMLGRPVNAVMTNIGETVPLGDGRSLKSGSEPKKHESMLRDLSMKGLKASNVDVLLTTYNQMQTVQGKATVRQEVIRALANGGVVLFDESHNAGGQKNTFKEAGSAPNRAEFARELVANAQGVFYSSATYAKRPDVMDLYAATDMKLAVDDVEKLGEAIAKGGVPMQQVVAAMLARSGQYVRRERSFDGIAYNTPVIEVDREQYNNVATVLAAIQDFSEGYVKDAVALVDQEVRESGENVAHDGSMGGAGAASTNFTAVMHNVVDQMLLAFAADSAAQRAIETIQRGEKPVITLASTLETFIDEYASEADLKPGDKIDITFADIFHRYLERTRRYTVKKPFADKKDKPARHRLTDQQLGAAGVAAFREAQQLISTAGLDSLPGSPLDYILGKIEAAGYNAGEITGRAMGIDYRPDGTYLKKRGQGDRSIKGRLATINGFNDGTINAMILNKSGATGLSLHASEKFKDKSKRRMIIVQAEGNIDTHMQMLGRVHRTGQVVLPEYDQLVVGVPAARRPAAVLAKKMASLNANTTASRDSALTSSEVLDFMNVYGDEITARIMEEEPDIHLRLGSPLAENDKGGLNHEEAARKVTGRIPLLPIDLQEELYQRLEDEYSALIAQKDAAGENALEAKTFDFDAQTVDRIETVAPVVGSTSPFADGVYVEQVKVKRTGRPMPGREVIGEVAANLDLEDVPQGDARIALAALQADATRINAQRLRDTVGEAKAYIETAAASIKDEEKRKAERDKLAATLQQFQAIRNSFKPGDTVRISTENGNVYGVVMDIYRGGRAKNPAALGVWRARFAIVDAAREMTVSFSQIQTPGGKDEGGRIKIEQATTMGLFNIIDAFDQMQVESREDRSIITGNLLAGFDYVNGKGSIINYTAAGGQVRQGILMPRDFNLEKHQKGRPIALSTPEMVDAFLRAPTGGGNIIGNGKTGQVAISALPGRDLFTIAAAKAKSSGGEFFLNRNLTAIMGDFVSKSNGMIADGRMADAIPAIRVLMEGGVRFEVPAGASDDTKAVAREIVDRLRPPAPAAPEPVAPRDAVEQQTQSTVNPLTDVAQPDRAMTERQRSELAARQQQGMARRGGQEAISDQSGGLFSAERDQSDMFSIDDAAEQAQRDWGDVVPRLNEAVKKLGIADKVTVEAVDQIFNNPNIAGRYRARVIQVALSTSQDPEYTLDHEAIHAMRDLGLFRPSEWSALSKAVQRDAALMASVRQRYTGLNEERIIEEGISDMFAQWRAGRRSQSGFARQALQRVLDFLSAIRRTVRGARAEDEVRDILRRLESGDIGGRDPDGPGGGGARDSRIGDAVNSLMSSGVVDTIREQSDVWRTRLQDRFLPLMRAQQRVEMQSGKPLPESQDAYLAEELMTGKVGSRLERLADGLVNPLFDTMKGLGLTVDEVETYLYARHAAERNARISSINDRFAEGTGSGMTDAEAAGILSRADAEGKIAALETAAEHVDAILKFALDTRIEAGLLSQEEADAWKDTYQFYVPLRGRGELEPENGSADRPRFGSGINVRGKESKRAFGRESRAANILAYSIMQAEEAIARAGRNEVAQAFYNMAQANPDPDFWTTNRVTRKPTWNEATGTVVYRNENRVLPEDEDYTVSLKIDGQERRVTMNRDNPAAARLAAAMRNLDAPAISGVLRVMSSFNRFLSRVNTGWNPEFIITNAFRDVQTATVNLAGVDAQGIIAGTLRDYRAALVASVKVNVTKNESGEWGKWYREFVDEGGRVFFNIIEDVDQIARRIEKQVSSNATGADGVKMKVKGVAKATFDFIDAANTGLENAVRLSAYKNAREAGMTKAQSASLAKNLTVNFNRRGDWGVTMNALYLFYNASVQGTARMLQAIATPGRGGRRVRRILFGVATASFALEMLNAMMSGDDDDGESYYDKIGEFEKSRNLIIMVPGGENGRYVKIPMSYGYNTFATIGRAMASVARGRPVTEGLSTIVGSMVDSFNPVGGTNLLNFLTPTIIDPIVDLYQNKDFAERPIYREQQPYGSTEPNSQMYWGSVNPIWREFASGINAATGGDEVIPGAVDINPEVLEYLWGVGTGAAGTFIADRMFGTVSKLATGEEVEMNDLPLARKLVGGKPGWYDRAAYYTRVEEIEQIASRPKEYGERGMYDAAEAFARENEAALSLMPDVKAAKREMKKLRAAKAEVVGALGREEIPEAEAKAAQKEIKASEEAIIARFNSAYLRVIEVPTRP